MVKNNEVITQHISKIKGNIFTERLKISTPEKTMIVPVEIGKDSHKALLANYYGEIFKAPFEFHNSLEGVRYFNNTVSKYAEMKSTENIFVAMEATGHYYKNIANSMYSHGYNNLFILNPVTTSLCRKAGLTWSKTDEVDLRAIGQALICGYGTVYSQEKPYWDDLKELCRYRRFQVRHETALKNKLHAVLDRILPGIDQLKMFRNSYMFHQSSLEFFLKYHNSQIISQLRPNKINEFFKNRNRRLKSEAGYDLVRWSKTTIKHDSPANETREEILKSLLIELKQLCETISELEVEILSYFVRTPAVLLLSIDGVGPLSGSEFAAELPSFDNCISSKAMIKSAGLDSTRYQSSTQESTDTHISRKGSARLRYISVIIAGLLINHNDYFRELSDKLIQERGKTKDCAYIATACRFMRVAYWMIKDKKRFEPSNQLGNRKDPFDKIKLFLADRKASDKIEEYTNLASKYLNKTE
ncbi:MAG: IS110 family transposase [Bacteroidetes bacterium]|nr:IS110 family transposase [Bacteroidota bacterium]